MKLQYDRPIIIAEGRGFTADYSVRNSYTVSAFYTRLATPYTDTITLAEYQAARNQSELKSRAGGYVCGEFRGGWQKDKSGNKKHYYPDGCRSKEYLLYRTALTLDVDYLPMTDDSISAAVDRLKALHCSFFWHTTRTDGQMKSGKLNRRIRFIIPTDRKISGDEHRQAVAAISENVLDPAWMDATDDQPERLMFYPSISSDQKFEYGCNDEPFLNVDELLTRYPAPEEPKPWQPPTVHQQSYRQKTAYTPPTGKMSIEQAREKCNQNLLEYMDEHGIPTDRNFTCPWHKDGHERDPSAALMPSGDRIYCPSCESYGLGKHGVYDMFDLEEKLTGCSSGDALRTIFSRYGIDWRDVEWDGKETVPVKQWDDELTAWSKTSAGDDFIIPWDATLTDDGEVIMPEQQAQPAMPELVQPAEYDPDALAATGPVFIVSTMPEVQAILSAGYAATGGGAEDITRYYSTELQNYPIICYDADIAAAVSAAGIGCYRLPETFRQAITAKDAESGTVQKIVSEAATAATEAFKQWRESNINRLKKSTVSNALAGFFSRAAADYNDPIQTGITALDIGLEGGLYPGLTTIGSGTGAGKTSLALQIADYIAQSGHYVLYVSLEVSRDELIAKSLSRMTYELALDRHMQTSYARTTREMLRGKEYHNYPRESRELMQAAMERYEKFGERILVYESVADLKVSDIEKVTRTITSGTGQRPVVIVDYLQILQPEDDRLTDKQALDQISKRLKLLSKNCQIPVVCISSFSRAAYDRPVDYSSYKESGLIEYTSNVLAGIQLEGFSYVDGESEGDRKVRIANIQKQSKAKARAGEFYNIEFVIIKSRFESGCTVNLEFNAKYGFFRNGKTDTDKRNERAKQDFAPVSAAAIKKMSRSEQIEHYYNEFRQANEELGMNDADPTVNQMMQAVGMRSESSFKKALTGSAYTVDGNKVRKGAPALTAQQIFEAWSLYGTMLDDHPEDNLKDIASFWNSSVERVREAIEAMPEEFRIGEDGRIIRVKQDDQQVLEDDTTPVEEGTGQMADDAGQPVEDDTREDGTDQAADAGQKEDDT